MAFIRHYIMQSSPENAQTLDDTLAALREAVLLCKGSAGVDHLKVIDEPGRFFFIEHWETKADHAAALTTIPPALMAPLQSLLIAKPVSTDLTGE